MAAVTVWSDFGAQENKICHCFYFFPFYLPLSGGTRCYDLHFWNVEAEVDFFFWNFIAFSMSQQMLAIWSVVTLPLLTPVFTCKGLGSCTAET